jgi:cell shape-determining protein MreC
MLDLYYEEGLTRELASARVCQDIVLKEEKEMLIAQLVEMDRVVQENQHLKKMLASQKRE